MGALRKGTLAAGCGGAIVGGVVKGGIGLSKPFLAAVRGLTLLWRARSRIVVPGSGIMLKARRHVVPNLHGGWSVLRSGASRASRRFPTEADAVAYAARFAKREGMPVYIHDSGGEVLRKETYGADAAASKQER